MTEQSHILSEVIGKRLVAPFDLIASESAPVPINSGHLFKVIIELLAEGLRRESEFEALIHIPHAGVETLAAQIGVASSLSHTDLYLLTREKDQGGLFTSLGKLPRLSPMKKEALVVLREGNGAAVISGRPPKIKGDPWSLVVSTWTDHVRHALEWGCSVMDVGGAQDGWSSDRFLTPLNHHVPDCGGTLGTRIFSRFMTEVGENLEVRGRHVERDLRWFRTITKIQDSVGWELDGPKLNNAVAKALKTSIGYDYLELHCLQQAGRGYETISTFQRNDTSFGGPLLTVILHPERQEELLRGRKPVILDDRGAKYWLMNSRLMQLMGLASGALVPLIFQRRPNGLLKLFSRLPGHYADADGEKLETIGRLVAKSLENAKVHSTMRRMATVDGLTNVYNHRFFSEQFLREFKRAMRYKSNLSLLMLDIDFFKQYNDNNGHLQGDQVLMAVGKILKTNVREVDLVCRYGGEEFVVILPETEIEQAKVVGEKIRKAIEDYSFKSEQRQPGGKVTISIGVAEGVADIESPSELVNRADVALYRAKKLGRNRCEVF